MLILGLEKLEMHRAKFEVEVLDTGRGIEPER